MLLSRALEETSRETKGVLLIALLGGVWILLLGARSDVHLGDEPTHYILASTIYETRGRPVYYPNIYTSPLAERPVGGEILWHSLLAGTWWLWGARSAVLAQLYQVGWYILLVLSTYLLARTLYDKQVGLYSGFLVATMPMIAAYSIILYTDVPLVSLSLVCLLLLVKRRHLLAGIVLGLMILTKRNAYLFMPSLLFCLLYSMKEIRSLKELTAISFLKEACKSLSVFILPAVLINLPDLYFRYTHFNTILTPSSSLVPSYLNNVPVTFIHPESIAYYPSNILKYPGIVMYLCLGLYLLRRQYCQKDAIPVAVILSYSLLFPLVIIGIYLKGYSLREAVENLHNIINTNFSIRYLAPIFPMLAILAAKGLVTLKKEKLKKIIFSFCVLQMLIGTLYVYQVRKLSPPLIKAYEYIRNSTPQDSRFISPYTDVALHTRRGANWSSENNLPDLPYLFWRASPQEVEDILKEYGITHILVPRDMVWDDSAVKNLGKYPASFVARLQSFEFLEQIFSNEAVSIWAIRPSNSHKRVE
ncbi:MAG: glycosyltransferase family 39 protein [Candidatus Brocadiales bacterium]|nr:glycosyltransferase family 39 protein [Candidatus Brocadiales bacterium]